MSTRNPNKNRIKRNPATSKLTGVVPVPGEEETPPAPAPAPHAATVDEKAVVLDRLLEKMNARIKDKLPVSIGNVEEIVNNLVTNTVMLQQLSEELNLTNQLLKRKLG